MVHPGAKSVVLEEPGKEHLSTELGAYTHLREEQTPGWHLEAELPRGLQGPFVVFVAAAVVCLKSVLRHAISRDFRQPPSGQEVSQFQSKRHSTEK